MKKHTHKNMFASFMLNWNEKEKNEYKLSFPLFCDTFKCILMRFLRKMSPNLLFQREIKEEKNWFKCLKKWKIMNQLNE